MIVIVSVGVSMIYCDFECGCGCDYDFECEYLYGCDRIMIVIMYNDYVCDSDCLWVWV